MESRTIWRTKKILELYDEIRSLGRDLDYPTGAGCSTYQVSWVKSLGYEIPHSIGHLKTLRRGELKRPRQPIPPFQ